jgi:hypothetical protein
MKQSVRDGPQRLLHWLGAHEMTVVLAIAGIAAGVWMFAALAGEVIEGDTLAFDRAVLLALRQPGTLAPLAPRRCRMPRAISRRSEAWRCWLW